MGHFWVHIFLGTCIYVTGSTYPITEPQDMIVYDHVPHFVSNSTPYHCQSCLSKLFQSGLTHKTSGLLTLNNALWLA